MSSSRGSRHLPKPRETPGSWSGCGHCASNSGGRRGQRRGRARILLSTYVAWRILSERGRCSTRARASPWPTARVMVRRMKLTGRTGALAICVLVAVAAAGLLGSHEFRTSRTPAELRCPKDPGVALGCYEQHYRSIVDRQGVAVAVADLKAGDA